MPEKKQLTGYPSIDKPWLKYYSEEAINAPLPQCTLYTYAYENNQDNMDGIAFRYFGTKITYRTFFNLVKRTAKAFYAHGVRKGNIVTIMSMHTPETIYAFYALNYIGAAANMVYMTLSEQEILDTVQTTESKMLFVLDTAIEKINAIQDKLHIPVVVLSVAGSMPAVIKAGYLIKTSPPTHGYIDWKKFIRYEKKCGEIIPSSDSKVLAVIVYTSGTTGEPKGVMLSNDNITSLVSQYIKADFRFEKGQTYMSIIPLFLGYGIGMQSIAVCTGLNSELWIRPEANAVAREYARTLPNHIEIGLTMLDAFLNTPIGDMSRVVNFNSGGGGISPEKEREVNSFLKQHNANVKLIMGYGMTELSSGVCNNLHGAIKESSVGVPLPKANVKVIDTETQSEQKYGEIGEICFSAPNLMMGYYLNQKATEDVIKVDDNGTRWIYTGDLGYVDEDGFVFIKGRKKRIFTTLGVDNHVYRLFPQRIEEFIESLPMIDCCAVIVKGDSQRLHIPIVYVCYSDKDINKEESLKILRNAIEMDLPSHMWPETIHIIETMPMTQSGKIDYRALERMASK